MDIWVVATLASTTLIPFSYLMGHRKGFVKGGRVILGEWRKFNEEMENRYGE